MRVGVSLFFQNYADWDRYMGGQFSQPHVITDAQIYEEELRLASLAEPLGFDSIWAPEHHFNPFTMTCNTLQLMSYFAGRTERLDMGTMVVVLPWHNPVRVAEEIAILDNLLGDRNLSLGFGRGMAQLEFDGFQLDVGESRERMEESFDIVRLALTQERFSYEGKFFHIPEMSIRPRPRTPDLTENMFGTAAGPDSLKYWASEGAGNLFVGATSLEGMVAQNATFNAIRAEHGWDPISTLGAIYVYCAETEAQAQELGKKYVGNVMRAGLDHYKLLEVPSIVSRFVNPDGPPLSEEKMAQMMIDGFVEGAVIGTPDQCRERLIEIQKMLNNAEYMFVLKYGAMPYDEAEKSMRLLAREALPALHEIPVTMPKSTPFSVVQASRKAKVGSR